MSFEERYRNFSLLFIVLALAFIVGGCLFAYDHRYMITSLCILLGIVIGMLAFPMARKLSEDK